MKKFLLILLLFVSVSAISQRLKPEKLDTWVSEGMVAALEEHRELVSIPCDANYPEDMEKNVKWLEQAFEKRGFEVSRLQTSSIPVVLAERETNKKLPWVLFYIHFDGQPIDPAKWDQDDPYVPVIKTQNDEGQWMELPYTKLEEWEEDWRIYARAAADDKGPIIMFLHAMDLIDKQKLSLGYNVKVMLDGEEEKGSRGLKETLSQYKERYKADRLVIMDGPSHPSNRPSLTFGCRGTASARLTVYGPKTPQHSGHYGNYAPNPVFKMSHLLSSMKDAEGKTLVEGFYDGITINEEARKILSNVPDNEEEIQSRLGIAIPDKVGNNYQEALQYPTLNVKGMSSGWIGKQTRTIIPESATAEIGIRLVVETDGKRMQELLKRHIEKQGYYVIDREPTDEERRKYENIATYIAGSTTPAFRTDMDSPMGDWLTGALAKVHDQELVRIRTMGGTIPVTPIIDEMGIPAVILPLVNADNNQHSPNENLRVGNLQNGIKSLVGILTEKF